MSVSQLVYEAMVKRLADRDEEIDRLRAEVKRRGEMLCDCLDHLHIAKRHYGSFNPIRSAVEKSCDHLIEQIEALADEN